MGKKQGLELLAEAARQHLHRKDLLYVFCGEGSYRCAFIELTRGLANVIHLPLQPFERLNDLLNLADIHLLPQRSDAADLVMPSKLTGMLASGRPVIATADSGTQLATVLLDCGLVTPPSSLDALASAILRLTADRDLRIALGQQARKYALAKLDFNSILGQFEKEILLACDGPGGKQNGGHLDIDDKEDRASQACELTPAEHECDLASTNARRPYS